MSLLRRVRAEVSGALRSVRYDMGRRPVEPSADGPDVTSTGMNTFGGLVVEDEQAAEPARPRRRAVAVSALGVLTVLAAAGAYLGVVNGLGSLLKETPAAADTFPPQPATTVTFAPNAGIGRGPGRAAVRQPAATATTAGPAAPDAAPATPVRNASPLRTTNTAKGECACGSPPVPTPTAPASSPEASPSGLPSDPPSPSATGEPSPSETSATPSDSAEPSESPHVWHRRRR